MNRSLSIILAILLAVPAPTQAGWLSNFFASSRAKILTCCALGLSVGWLVLKANIKEDDATVLQRAIKKEVADRQYFEEAERKAHEELNKTPANEKTAKTAEIMANIGLSSSLQNIVFSYLDEPYLKRCICIKNKVRSFKIEAWGTLRVLFHNDLDASYSLETGELRKIKSDCAGLRRESREREKYFHVAYEGLPCTINVYQNKLYENKLMRPLFVGNSPFTELDARGCSDAVAAGTENGMIYIWDARYGKENGEKLVGAFKAHDHPITDLDSHLDKQGKLTIVSTSDDKTIKIWEFPFEEETKKQREKEEQETKLAVQTLSITRVAAPVLQINGLDDVVTEEDTKIKIQEHLAREQQAKEQNKQKQLTKLITEYRQSLTYQPLLGYRRAKTQPLQPNQQ